ncbi:hypothetical protein ACLKA6_005150 [Drosophila palustris]
MTTQRLSKNLKHKLTFLIYENEYFQDLLHTNQRRLLKVSRDRSFLIDRLLLYEKPDKDSSDKDSSDSDATDSSNSGAEHPRRDYNHGRLLLCGKITRRRAMQRWLYLQHILETWAKPHEGESDIRNKQPTTHLINVLQRAAVQPVISELPECPKRW